MTEKEIKAQKAIDKRKLFVVKGICNRIRMGFSFKNIKTWADVYKIEGRAEDWINTQANREVCVTLKDIQKYIYLMEENLKESLEKKYAEQQLSVSEHIQDSSQTAPTVVTISPKDVSSPFNEPNQFLPVKEPEDKGLVSDDENDPEYNEKNNYGLTHSPKENPKLGLYWFQKKAAAQALHKITVKKLRAILIIACPGAGKTFIQGAIDRRLKDMNFTQNKTWGHIHTLAITKNSVVEQMSRVYKEMFNISPIAETEVINIERLRTRAAQIWINNTQTIINGVEVELWHWKDLINPAVIFLDECQGVKNAISVQTKIMLAYSKIPNNTTQIYLSATPFTTVTEAKVFAIATRRDISHLGFPAGTLLSEETWGTYSAAIASPSSPDEKNEAAVGRLMKDLDDYVVRVKKIKWQFNCINHTEIIDFPSDSIRREYETAEEEYYKKKARLEEDICDDARIQAMVILGQFLIAAEYCKRDIFAERMHRYVQEGYAAVCAVKNKKTIIAIVKNLVNKYGVSRDQISIIWGGGQTQLTAKQKLKAQVRANEDIFKQAGISMDDLELGDVADRELEELPKELRLGTQNKKQRQEEIDRFQCGKSLYCIYTYKAGGVGLSLHHTDEMTNNKVRRKKNGYAYVEDIPNIPTRPRRSTIGTTWSPIELVQGSSRTARLTSLSDTHQDFLYFRGTKEEYQAQVVKHGLKCLATVVRQRENWMDLLDNPGHLAKIVDERVKKYEAIETDEPQTDIVIDVGDEEESEQ